MTNLKQAILQGIPTEIPTKRNINTSVSHAPNRKNILNKEEKKLPIRNPFQYSPNHMHPV